MSDRDAGGSLQWFQFSLRALLVLLLMVACFCAGLSWQGRRLAEAEAAAKREAQRAAQSLKMAERAQRQAQQALYMSKIKAAEAQMNAWDSEFGRKWLEKNNLAPPAEKP